MKRLFVDIDNTLIRWLPEHGADGKQKWETNEDVLRFMRWWPTANPNCPIVIWSHGGMDYAAEFAAKVVPEDISYIVTPKKYFAGGDVDTFLDDDPDAHFVGELIHPDELADFAGVAD